MQEGANNNRGYTQLYVSSQSVSLEILCELGRATTAYHEATPDRAENARQEYEEALRRFNASCSDAR
jgi:hypothetical protein